LLHRTNLQFGSRRHHSGEKHTAKPVQVGTPHALFDFDESFRLPYSLKTFKGAISKVQSFSL
jgi:hypothetical protein